MTNGRPVKNGLRGGLFAGIARIRSPGVAVQLVSRLASQPFLSAPGLGLPRTDASQGDREGLLREIFASSSFARA